MPIRLECPSDRNVEPTSPPAVLARVGMEEDFLFSCILRTLVSASWILKSDPNTKKMLKRMLFVMTKHNMQTFGVSPFFKVRNNT